nr:Gp138 family membrane-puncturing spike protein [Paenibacillus sp. Marseille-Q4541]
MPCEILSYNQSNQTATIKPLIRSITDVDSAPIEDVPALGQRLMINGYETYCPPVYHRGDVVLVVFTDRECKGILQGQSSGPQYSRQHSIMDGVIVGVFG